VNKGGKMKQKYITLGLGLFVLGGCTAIKVNPVDSSYKISHICIEKNKKVIVSDFVTVLEEGIKRHGMTSEIFSSLMPNYCHYRMSYVATRKWDLAPYLTDADINLYKGNEKIGTANYHLKGGGGLDLSKWAGTRSKIAPVIDKLFANTKAGKPFDRASAIQNEKKETNDTENKASKLRSLHKLMIDGVITEEEFNIEKTKILGAY